MEHFNIFHVSKVAAASPAKIRLSTRGNGGFCLQTQVIQVIQVILFHVADLEQEPTLRALEALDQTQTQLNEIIPSGPVNTCCFGLKAHGKSTHVRNNQETINKNDKK
jgi:hypothetical protein